MASNSQISISIVADAAKAQAELGKTGKAAASMGREAEKAGRLIESTGERLENIQSVSATVSGAFGDIGGALTLLTQKNYDAQDASLGLSQAQFALKQSQEAVTVALAKSGAGSDEYQAAMLNVQASTLAVQKAQDAVAGPQGTFGQLGAALEHYSPLILGVAGAFDILVTAVEVSKAAMEANVVATIASKVAQAGAAVATGVLTAAQWALNVAMDANPIGLIILAIAALIAVVVLLATNFESVRKFFGTVWDGLKDGTLAILSFLGSIPGKIVGFFEGLADKFRDYGVAVIRGFANGILDAVPGLRAAVEALAKALPDWIAKPLGIRSPSRVTHKLGRSTAQGFLEGFQSISATDVTGGLVKGIAGTKFSATGSVALASAHGGGNTYHVNVYSLNPTAETGRVIRKSLDAYERQAG